MNIQAVPVCHCDKVPAAVDFQEVYLGLWFQRFGSVYTVALFCWTAPIMAEAPGSLRAALSRLFQQCCRTGTKSSYKPLGMIHMDTLTPHTMMKYLPAKNSDFCI